MKLVYENLDTSFVNFPALVRYLRGKQFTGKIRLELSGYEADIIFNGENQPNAREHDRNAGRIAEGEQALQRIMIRAREAGGIINVYQAMRENTAVGNGTTANQTISAEKHVDDANNKTFKPISHRSLIVENSSPAQKTIAVPDANRNNFPAESKEKEIVGTSFEPLISETKTNGKTAPLPFDLSNKVEAKAKQNQLSDEEWKTLLNLIGELLRTVDEKLASANLNFPAAFQKACTEVSEDYPFLNPNLGTFVYRNGKIEMREIVNAKILVAGLNETLRRILLKLNANPKYAEAERATVQSVLALMHHRKTLYDKFYITPQLEKTLRT